jgi:nucleotide-binding universal stress UspA family protein
MKKILIALDYNPSSENVAEEGYELAKAMHADVTLLHVITDPVYYAAEYSPIMGYQGPYTEGTVAIVNDLKKAAWKFLTAAVRHLGDENIKIKVLEGDTEDAILEYSKSHKADLIVIGSHSHKGIERLFVADLAGHMVRHSKVPLYIIPTSEKSKVVFMSKNNCTILKDVS